MKGAQTLKLELGLEPVSLSAARDRVVEAARLWYTSTNESELAAAVQDYEHLIKQERVDG